MPSQPDADDNTISVLLPVHAGVAPDHLSRCLSSISSQSLAPDEVVIVEDGPLTNAHADILGSFERSRNHVIRLRLEVNSGAGVANQTGLAAATSTWIAKMDADDISLPERLERQLATVEATGVDVLGSAMAEFVDDERAITGLRSRPLTHQAIRAGMRRNNPFNHPTTFYRRSLASAVGGYPEMRFMQDYDLFARMSQGGAKMLNLAEPLVLFRSSPDLIRRRRSRQIIALEVGLQRNLRAYGVVGPIRQWVNVIWRVAARLLPQSILQLAYRTVFVRKTRSSDQSPGFRR